MWATTPTIVPFFPTPNSHRKPPSTTVPSATSSKDVGGLGQVVLTTLNSGPSTATTNKNTTPGQLQQKAKPKAGKEEKKEISGSDILWAMQRATAKKAQVSSNKKQLKIKGSGSGSTNQLKRESSKRVVDYGKVRPIIVKSDWATRLDDLEKQLEDFLSV